MGVLSEAFDVLVLRFGVQKRIYCNVSILAALGLLRDCHSSFPAGCQPVLPPRLPFLGEHRKPDFAPLSPPFSRSLQVSIT